MSLSKFEGTSTTLALSAPEGATKVLDAPATHRLADCFATLRLSAVLDSLESIVRPDETLERLSDYRKVEVKRAERSQATRTLFPARTLTDARHVPACPPIRDASDSGLQPP